MITDKGSHPTVAKMLFPDLHRNPVWIELFGTPQRVRVESEGSWISEAAAAFFDKDSVLLEPIPGQAHWQTGLVEPR